MASFNAKLFYIECLFIYNYLNLDPPPGRRVYARNLGSKVNPSQGQVPAQSWFTYSDPFLSNPWPESSVNFGVSPPVRPETLNPER